MKIDKDFQKIGDLLGKGGEEKKPPAYPWQELALKVIKELNIPNIKRSSIFKVCRDYPKEFIERCLADTKELCQTGEKWRYFLKLINEEGGKKTKESLS